MSEVSEMRPEALVRDDADARRLLQWALGVFQKWPEEFGGFSAAMRCCDGSRTVDGEVCVFPGGRVMLDVGCDDALTAWVQGALSAISWARTPRFFKDGEGRFPITFEPDDGHHLGRGVRVHLGDGAWRTYRVDFKGRIRQQEDAELARRATVTYDDFIRTCPGRTLPRRIRLRQCDATTDSVVETAEIADLYERRSHVWLPVGRRAVVAEMANRREFAFELTAHRLL